MFVSTASSRYQNDQYFTMDKSPNFHQTNLSPLPWLRDNDEFVDISSYCGEDLTNYLPKTLPCPQESTKINDNSIPSPEYSCEKQSINNNYKKSRKRRRKTYCSNNNNNSSESSSDIEFDDQHVHGSKKQRVVANDRERKRTQQLNEALSSLRRMVPSLPADKLSKYQTIKLATQYIEFLWTVVRKQKNQMEMNELNFAFTEWRLKSELQRNNF